MSLNMVLGFAYALLRYGPKIFLYPGAFEAHPREMSYPSDFGLQYTNLTLTTRDKVKIHAYLLMHDDANKLVGTQRWTDLDLGEPEATIRPTVIMLHGNADNIGHTIPLAQKFYTDMQCHVLMLSPRGYGLSEGQPSTKGLKRDTDAALDYVFQHSLLRNTPVIVYGQSMGAALAIDLVGRRYNQVRALIVENTFLSLRKLIPEIMPIFTMFAPFFRQWDSLRSISKMPLSLPILMLSGELDEVIPPPHMDGLWAAANPNGNKRSGRIVKFRNGHHDDTWDQHGYWEAVAEFVEEVRTP